MCVPPDSSPPLHPVAGGSGPGRPITLTASDGTEFSAHEAVPSAAARAAVIVLPDVRGLFGFYRELAERFADHGHRSVAVDYFGRTAGLADGRDDDFEFMAHVEQMTFDGLTADVAAAVAHIRSTTPTLPIITVGFCLGGSNSWLQATAGHGLAGAVGFYGNPVRERPPGGGSVIDRLHLAACPLLALMAGDDHSITPEIVDTFRTSLGAAEVDHDVVVYEGAPHSFFDRKYTEFADASADAWNRVLAFIDSVAG